MEKRRVHTGEFKAKVVTEFIKGRSLVSLAEKYQVHPNQIKNWKSLFLKRAHIVLADRRKNNSCTE